MTRYQKWYARKRRLLQSVEMLYRLYYKLSKENVLTENQIDEEVD